MELRSVTFYYEGFEITKNKVMEIFEELAEKHYEEADAKDYFTDLCFEGSVDVEHGIVSVVSEVEGIPDEFEYWNEAL